MTALSVIIKKFFIDILTDPEKLLKALIYGLLIPLLVLLLIFFIPIYLTLSVPSILLSGSTSPEVTEQQLQTIGIYQEAPVIINDNNLKWIREKEKEYSWCDDIVVNYNYNLSWQHLMSIDSVILEQDFTKANSENILRLGERFISRNVKVVPYKVIEHYEVEEEYTVNVIVIDPETREKSLKEEKRKRTVIKTREVTKNRALISINTKDFSQILNELKFNSFEKELATNIYNTILYSDVEGNLNIYDDIDLTELKEYPPGNANIPYYNQTDKRWATHPYGKSTIYSAGCGPTSLAMVVSGLTGQRVTPDVVADWSYRNGHRAEGQGSYWSLMTAGGRNYGLKVEQVSRRDPKAIVKALSEGYPVIVAMGRGHFTNGGHFIVLRGLTSDGKVLVYDSASMNRSNMAWDLSIIMNESSTKGGINGSPFWIFRR